MFIPQKKLGSTMPSRQLQDIWFLCHNSKDEIQNGLRIYYFIYYFLNIVVF